MGHDALGKQAHRALDRLPFGGAEIHQTSDLLDPERGVSVYPVDAFGRLADDEMIGVDLSGRAGSRAELGHVLVPPGVVQPQKAAAEKFQRRLLLLAVRDDMNDAVDHW